MMQEGLNALLEGSQAAALAQGGIFAGVAPDDKKLYPCVSYSLVGGSADPTLTTSGVIRQRVELNGFSFNSYAEAAEIRAAIIAALEGWQQQLSDGVNILDTVLLNPGTDFVSEQRCFRCMCEFYVLYTLPS
jgi:hypothetical protein